MRIALIGAGGQLAFDLKKALAAHEVIGLTREELDIRSEDSVRATIENLRPNLVVNAAAYNTVDLAEKEPAEAFANNAFGPLHLARACQQFDVTLAHFSTDYVFGQDFRRQTPWLETDAPGPVSVYGTSKLTGEYFVQANCCKHFVLRTCGLYGVKGSRGKGGNFVETMIRLASTGKPVKVVNDQWCTPSATADVAAAAAKLIDSNSYGLYHLTNAGGCTWYELACEIFRQMNLNVECLPITSAEFGAPARRPPYSVLDCSKLAHAGVPAPRSWKDGLANYLEQRKDRQSMT